MICTTVQLHIIDTIAIYFPATHTVLCSILESKSVPLKIDSSSFSKRCKSRKNNFWRIRAKLTKGSRLWCTAEWGVHDTAESQCMLQSHNACCKVRIKIQYLQISGFNLRNNQPVQFLAKNVDSAVSFPLQSQNIKLKYLGKSETEFENI